MQYSFNISENLNRFKTSTSHSSVKISFALFQYNNNNQDDPFCPICSRDNSPNAKAETFHFTHNLLVQYASARYVAACGSICLFSYQILVNGDFAIVTSTSTLYVGFYLEQWKRPRIQLIFKCLILLGYEFSKACFVRRNYTFKHLFRFIFLCLVVESNFYLYVTTRESVDALVTSVYDGGSVDTGTHTHAQWIKKKREVILKIKLYTDINSATNHKKGLTASDADVLESWLA